MFVGGNISEVLFGVIKVVFDFGCGVFDSFGVFGFVFLVGIVFVDIFKYWENFIV